MTTREEIRGWLEESLGESSHMIVVCDTFNHDDYPVYVSKKENVSEVFDRYHDKHMQRVMEVYSYKLNLECQLSEDRAFHFD